MNFGPRNMQMQQRGHARDEDRAEPIMRVSRAVCRRARAPGPPSASP